MVGSPTSLQLGASPATKKHDVTVDGKTFVFRSSRTSRVDSTREGVHEDKDSIPSISFEEIAPVRQYDGTGYSQFYYGYHTCHVLEI